MFLFFFVKLQILIFIFFLDKFLQYVPTYFQKALFIYIFFLINLWNMSLPIFKKHYLFFWIGPEPKPYLSGDTRTFRVWLDPNQYQQDMTSTMDGDEVHVH